MRLGSSVPEAASQSATFPTGWAFSACRCAMRLCTANINVQLLGELLGSRRSRPGGQPAHGGAPRGWALPTNGSRLLGTPLELSGSDRPGGRPAHGGEVRRVVGASDQRRAHVLVPHAHGPVARARKALREERAARHAIHRRVVPCGVCAATLLIRHYPMSTHPLFLGSTGAARHAVHRCVVPCPSKF